MKIVLYLGSLKANQCLNRKPSEGSKPSEGYEDYFRDNPLYITYISSKRITHRNSQIRISVLLCYLYLVIQASLSVNQKCKI